MIPVACTAGASLPLAAAPVMMKPALSTAHAAILQPVGGRIGADEKEYMADLACGFFAAGAIAPAHAFESGWQRALQADDFGMRHQFDVGGRADAVDQIARHALRQAVAAHHQYLGDVTGQENRRLTRRIAATDENDFGACTQTRFDL